MKRLGLALALCSVFFGSAHAQVGLPFPGPGGPVAAAGLSVPASNFNCGSATAPTIAVAATPANTVFILGIETNSANVNTVTDTAGLTWTARVSLTNKVLEYWAVSAAALGAGTTITVTFNASGFYNLGVMAIAGANTVSPFDPNGSLPTLLASGVPSITTTNANTVIYGIERVNTSTPTSGAGFTQVSGSNSACFGVMQYKIVSAAQTGTSIPVTTGAGTELGTIADAVTK